LAYIGSLEKAQLGGSKDDYYELIAKSVERSLNIYLNALSGDTGNLEDLDSDSFMKIGELAAAVKQTVPTIRFWTNEGLLKIAEFTDSGYTLYDHHSIDRCQQIQKLKSKRFTLQEIKKRLA
jgi:hypothetical protein